jgi:hypothetical protein
MNRAYGLTALQKLTLFLEICFLIALPSYTKFGDIHSALPAKVYIW